MTTNSLSALSLVNSSSSFPDETISHDMNFNDLVSNAYQQVSEHESQLKERIDLISSSPQLTSNPESLLKLQNYIGDLTNYISLVSTVARKTVTTIETLEKSQ